MEYKLFFNWAKQNFLLKYFTKKHHSIFYFFTKYFTKKKNTLKMHSKALSSLFSIIDSICTKSLEMLILGYWKTGKNSCFIRKLEYDSQ